MSDLKFIANQNRGLIVGSLIIASTALTYYARKGSVEVKVAAVALAVITLFASIDFLRYTFRSLKSHEIKVNQNYKIKKPTDFVVLSSQKGQVHWKFKLLGKPIEVKEFPHNTCFGWFAHSFQELNNSYRIDNQTPENLAEWLEKSSQARETAHKDNIDSPKAFGLVLPICWNGRDSEIRDGLARAYKAINILLRKKHVHEKVERITIMFQNPGLEYSNLKPEDLGVTID